jgi:hypothetical protein
MIGRKQIMMRELTYSRNGDYLIPDLELTETTGTIGKYGMLRKEFLRQHRKITFDAMTLKNTLDRHLMEVDLEAKRKIENLMMDLLKTDPAPDKMKDQMGWTQHMNRIQSQAEEMILEELIYN